MSYDLAVWEGERPPTDEAAGELFQSLSERYLEADDPEPPSDRIRAYVSALVERYPDDLPDNDVDDCPWAVGPLVSAAVGPLIDFPMVWSRCEEVSAWAADLAAAHGLVCYDPQLDRLRPFEQPAERQHSFEQPAPTRRRLTRWFRPIGSS